MNLNLSSMGPLSNSGHSIIHMPWRCGGQSQQASMGQTNAKRETRANLMLFLADKHRHETELRLHQSGVAVDPITTRTIKHIYLSAAKEQQDEETIDKITQLEAEMRQLYFNFRAKVGGVRKNDNELDAILQTSPDSDDVHEAWEAIKQIGAQVADQVRELARLPNTAAQAQGFRDHFLRMLTLNEIDEQVLLPLFQNLEVSTREPFLHLKIKINLARAAHFRIDPADLYHGTTETAFSRQLRKWAK